MKKLKNIKLIIFITLIISFITIQSCKRAIFEDNIPESNNAQGEMTTTNFSPQTMEQLYPENGQAGGIESAGGNTSNLYFRADLYSVTPNNWNVMTSLLNVSTQKGINDAEINLYCKISDNTYKKFKLLKVKDRDGDYFLFRFNAPFVTGKRAGYFHIINKTSNIDFKLGFGVNKVTIGNLNVNGQRPISGRFIKVSRGNLNIRVSASGGVYYQVLLRSNAGIRDINNYYAPGGNIQYGQELVSNTSGYVDLTVYAHNIYIARGFKTIIYPDGSKNNSGISVAYGDRIVESTILEVQ